MRPSDTSRLAVDLPPALHEQLREAAASKAITLKHATVEAVKLYLFFNQVWKSKGRVFIQEPGDDQPYEVRFL